MANLSLSIRGLTKFFGPFAAVAGIDLDLHHGELLALLGPSGCGKTTTLRMVAGLERPTDGEISFGDRVLVSIARAIELPPEKRNVGMVFQSYALWPHMTVGENIAYPLQLRGVAKATIREKLAAVLDLVNLAGAGGKQISQLSGGQQQRVALARSLIYEPGLMLFDEPFSNLDTQLRVQMRLELKMLRRKVAMTGLFVTHDQVEALSMADRIAIMNAGRIEQVGSPREVYRLPRTRFVRDFLGRVVNLRGIIGTRGGAAAFLLGDNGDALALSSALASNFRAGDAAELSIRPEFLELLAEGEAGRPRFGLGRDRGFAVHRRALRGADAHRRRQRAARSAVGSPVGRGRPRQSLSAARGPVALAHRDDRPVTQDAHPLLAAPPSGAAWLLRRLSMARAEVVTAFVFAAVAFLVLYPIGTVIFLTFLPNSLSDVFGTIPWYRAFAEPGMLQSVANTIYVVVAVQVISMPIAIVISWFLARTDLPGGRSLEFCFWIMFFLPAMGVMTGWLLLFDPDFGLVNRALVDLGLVTSPVFNLYSFWGIVFVHLTTYGIAVKVMLLTPAFRNLDGAVEEASYLCGANRRQTLVRIVLPLLAPAIFVVLLMSIIRGLETFEIELILGTPIKFQVYSTKLYMLMANSPPEFRAAGTLGVSVMAMVLPLIVLQRWASTRRSYAVLTGRASSTRIRLRRWRWPAFFLLAGSVCFMSLLPFVLLVAGSFMKLFGFFNLPEVWTVDHWFKALDNITFTSSLRNMLYLGFGTSALAVSVYSLVAYCTVRGRSRLRGALDMITWMPYTVPGIVLGFGYLNMALHVPLFALLYGTVGALIMVSFLASMPLGVQVIKVNLLQMGTEIEEAGRIAGGGWISTFRRIVVPIGSPTLAVVGIMVFASTIRNVSSVMLLSTGANRVLSVLQVEFLADGNLGPAAVVGTVIVLISLAAALVVRFVSLRFGIQARGE